MSVEKVIIPGQSYPDHVRQSPSSQPLQRGASPQRKRGVEDYGDEGLYLHFLATGESFYNEIRLENGELRYTWFEDKEGRCEQWVQSAPCWRESDLQTVSKPLPDEELATLRRKVRDSGVLQLAQETFGGASQNQRYYAQKLDIRINGEERHLEYQSFPGAAAKPAGFAEVEQLLTEYVRGIGGKR